MEAKGGVVVPHAAHAVDPPWVIYEQEKNRPHMQCVLCKDSRGYHYRGDTSRSLN